MGKLLLISGANDSGKSRWAEQLISALPGKKYYIATMKPVSEDNYRRIEKHKNQRACLGFQTLEQPYKIEQLSLEPESTVLLEDVSNLMANCFFELGQGAGQVFESVEALADSCSLLVAVTISGLESYDYDEETTSYINALNELNRMLFDRADVAVYMKDGEAECIKGALDDLY